LEYINLRHRFAKDGWKVTSSFKRAGPGVYIGLEDGFSIGGIGIEKESGSQADSPILAGRLVAVAGGFGETVKVALLSLPFAIEGNQSFLEAFCAKSVRVPISVRVPPSPCFIASYALIHHKSFLVQIAPQK